MSPAAEAAKALADALDADRRNEREQRTDIIARLTTIESAVRTGVRINQDQFEATSKQFSEIMESVADLKRKLGTNGSGGHG